MFVFGTDGTTFRAWPVHTIKSVTYNPSGSPTSGGKPELALHLVDGTVAWLRGTEAQAVWRKITAEGIGQPPSPPQPPPRALDSRPSGPLA
jgi:hypothetical protein